jgi:hypothetical protein
MRLSTLARALLTSRRPEARHYVCHDDFVQLARLVREATSKRDQGYYADSSVHRDNFLFRAVAICCRQHDICLPLDLTPHLLIDGDSIRGRREP